ncbi:MAG: carboxypeptidase regulatory-like domain-containing protein [Labilithrix sp.]|nr:carboxypeptidase regulatory-like domain-containing protein [Labilithrix sp.]MCW5810690.1 carboxypeptidase regulatory-like domain-containing protein [Labilithrix sp.]
MFRRWVALVALGLFAVVVSPRVARADQSTAHTVSVAVLALDSDDAEEQADALTNALKSRIRNSQGWSLTDTTQSLGMLTAALRCPTKPIPADCEQRISEHLKTERFIFGYVTKGPQKGEVTAEVHLYQKSKPDTVVRETYSENLKDGNDDTLRARAQTILERLGGSAVGTIVVKMGNENGEVVVDGDKRVPLTNGSARIELAPGTHSVEVATAGGAATQKRNVQVTAGKEQVVDLALEGSAVTPGEPAKGEKPFPTHTVIGGSLAALGVGAAVISVVFAFKYKSAQDEGESLRHLIPEGQDIKSFCGSRGNESQVCQLDSDSKTFSTVAWVTGGLGAVLLGAGAYFLFFGGDAKAAASNKPLKNVRATPTFGLGGGGLSLSGAF